MPFGRRGVSLMTVEIVRIHPTEAKKMRRLHRHWSPGTEAPAGLGGAGTVGIVASSEYRQLGYALASAPHGLIRTAREAGWSPEGCERLAAHTRIVEALVVNPEVPDAGMVRAALIARLIAELTDDTAGNGRLYGSTEDLPERVQFWRELGFEVREPNTPTTWEHPGCRTLRYSGESPGCRPFTRTLGGPL
ncbi:hypothetical protein BH686_05705 [Rhodococcus erythropolis]|nr:hypothetical protein BH686_05705 [Rhodococcus erythropolis]